MVTDTIQDEDNPQIRFAASSDDAEQENDEIDALYDDDIDAGWEGEPEDQNILTAGLRFREITIPQGAVIDSAFIIVTSHEAKTADDVANITIVGEATDDAQTFTDDMLIDARPQTSASIRWIVDEPWGLWTPHSTPDLSPIVQEIVDRPGWESGNSIAFILLGEDQGPSEVENAREFESFENIADPEDGGDGQNYPDRVPMLCVYYSSPNATTSVRTIFAPEVKELKVFPNPAQSGLVTIELETNDASIINIFNTNGQLLRTQRFDFGKQVQMNTGNLPTGVYYIQARQNDELYIQKLVIEK